MRPKDTLRGIVHCHSRFSDDSSISISAYLRFAREAALDFVILTDHDTTEGSRALNEAAKQAMPRLEVPLAAEYKTDQGDIIAAFLAAEIRPRAYSEVIAESRRQGAVLLLPHPFVSHRDPERLAADCDLVETFNSRAKPAKNRLAQELAIRARKPGFAGSDAHLARSLGYAVIEVPNHGDLRTSLLRGEIRCDQPIATPPWQTAASQYVKAVKRRDPGLAFRLTAGLAKAAWKKAAR